MVWQLQQMHALGQVHHVSQAASSMGLLTQS